MSRMFAPCCEYLFCFAHRWRGSKPAWYHLPKITIFWTTSPRQPGSSPKFPSTPAPTITSNLALLCPPPLSCLTVSVIPDLFGHPPVIAGTTLYQTCSGFFPAFAGPDRRSSEKFLCYSAPSSLRLRSPRVWHAISTPLPVLREWREGLVRRPRIPVGGSGGFRQLPW